MKKILTTVLLFLIASQTFSAESNSKNEEKEHIADNSFLIEEAYNQEPRVVQHISVFQYNKDKTWDFSFTDEWPLFIQDHQISFTIPVSHTEEGESKTGLGDIFLNYRYQAIMNKMVAFSPRFSLGIPTGKYEDGFGSGTLGLQFGLPLSLEINDLLVAHFNGGLNYYANSKSAGDIKSNITETFYGFSAIIRPLKSFHILVELTGKRTDVSLTGSNIDPSYELTINPGFRHAIDFDSGLQICWGLSVPIGIGPSKDAIGYLGYLSFEHGF